jgi:hypothetical protein
MRELEHHLEKLTPVFGKKIMLREKDHAPGISRRCRSGTTPAL